MTTATLDQALEVARALTRHERARLVAVLVEELAHMPAPTSSADPAALLAAVRERVAAIPARRTLGEQLEADRHERDMLLRGREETRVHD